MPAFAACVEDILHRDRRAPGRRRTSFPGRPQTARAVILFAQRARGTASRRTGPHDGVLLEIERSLQLARGWFDRGTRIRSSSGRRHGAPAFMGNSSALRHRGLRVPVRSRRPRRSFSLRVRTYPTITIWRSDR